MLSNKEKYNIFRPKKFLGQNFLVDDNIARKIVNSLNITDDDFILEIGPGHGALTKHILKQTKKFLAVEIDKSAAVNLKDKFGIDLNIIVKDFLELDFVKDLDKSLISKNLKVIGNIPYNITSEILFKLLDNSGIVNSAVVMIQKEVAERLVAERGTKQYGILAVQFQSFAKIKRIMNVPPTAFFPKPEVQSSVLRIEFKGAGLIISDRNLFREFVRNAFSKRRKTLKNSLQCFFEKYSIKPENIEFDFGRRAETLDLNEFIVLGNIFASMRKSDK